MNTVLIVDTETTGLSPTDSYCIEVGAILYNVVLGQEICQLSFVLPCLINPAQDVNNIPPAVTTLGPEPQHSIALFQQLVGAADAIVAHNADFDRQWFGIGMLPPIPESKPWICTMSDVPWPKDLRLKGRPSVTALALAHGVPVWAAHRALTDCIYLSHVFKKRSDLQLLLKAALEPRQLYQALVSYDERHLAKEAGFSWNTDGSKKWTRKMTQSEADTLPFATQPCTPN